MGEFWIQLLALLTLLTQTGSASDTPELIGAVGGSVTFHSPSTDGYGALWSFGDDPIVTVAFRDPPLPIFSEDKFKTRFTVSERGRALSISQLRMEDAGTYSVTIDGKISTFTLRVYKELPEPTVTCEAQECLGKICLFFLRCSVTGTGFGNVSYTWTGWDWLWLERSVVLAVVDKSSLDKLELLTCTAQNAVSTRSVTITNSEGLCPENSADPLGPGTLFGIWIGMGIGIGFSVLLLVFLVFLCKSKGYWSALKARLAIASSESPATARPGHQGYVQATMCSEPETGRAWDKRRTESKWAFSGPPRIIDHLGPSPGLTMDQLEPEPGLTMDEL